MEAVEAALIAAYRKTPDAWAQNVRIGMDPESGESRVVAQLAVVDDVQDRRTQVSIEAAQDIDPEAGLGSLVEIDVTPDDFGRIAAQTAKQVILQRIREAEREATYHTYADREGEIVQGTIQNTNPDGITVGLEKAEALLPRANQMSSERYTRNQRIRVYVQEVRKTPRGPEIIVSRTHKKMLRRLMEVEIPEIFNGAVEIKAIAREAGSRSKVAVTARQEGVDPVGACVGIRGVRIQALVNELSGEKIDVVAWDPDPAVFIANALSPAQVTNVRLVEAPEGRTAEVVVPDRQLSLAIGKEGQNARLAAKLTGWRIDIKSESEAAEEAIHRIQEEARRAQKLKELEAARALLAEARARETDQAAANTMAAELEPQPVAAAEAALPVAPEVVEPAAEMATAEAATVAAEEAVEVAWQETFQEEESEESGEGPPKKGKKKRKKRQLVFDEDLGEVVARKQRKPGRRADRWEREVDQWQRWDEIGDDEDADDFDEETHADDLDYEAEDEE